MDQTFRAQAATRWRSNSVESPRSWPVVVVVVPTPQTTRLTPPPMAKVAAPDSPLVPASPAVPVVAVATTAPHLVLPAVLVMATTVLVATAAPVLQALVAWLPRMEPPLGPPAALSAPMEPQGRVATVAKAAEVKMRTVRQVLAELVAVAVLATAAAAVVVVVRTTLPTVVLTSVAVAVAVRPLLRPTQSSALSLRQLARRTTQ